MKNFVVDSVLPGVAIGIVASSFGYHINQWQWWAIIIPANFLSTFLISYLRKVK